MGDINRVALFGKLNSLAYKSIEGATVFCKLRGNPYVELAHWLHQILQQQGSDLACIVRAFNLDAAQLASVQVGRTIQLEIRPALVTDCGTMQVVHAEGEFPWLVFLGRPAQFIDATSGSLFYSIERTEDAVEYYRGQFVDERQVYTIFGRTDLLRSLESREQKLRSRRGFGGVLLTNMTPRE